MTIIAIITLAASLAVIAHQRDQIRRYQSDAQFYRRLYARKGTHHNA